jgi:hypothetical protein
MNWTSAQDAMFMCESLQCYNADEIFTYLKASQNITDHITQGPYKGLEEDSWDKQKVKRWTVVLRRSTDNYNKGMEFKVIIKDGILIGLSQKDDTQYFPFLNVEMKTKIFESISTFCNDKLIPCFFNAKAPLKSFIADLYIDKFSSGFKSWILDMEPFLPNRSSVGLFDWEELNKITVENF